MITRWATTQAKREIQCPRCNAAPGSDCQTPKGKHANVHIDKADEVAADLKAKGYNVA